jgi:beta-glucuronidase
MAIPINLPLHGSWTRAIAGRDLDTVQVPGTWPACGVCTVHHEFDLPAGMLVDGDSFALVGEGVLSRATFTLNGQVIGESGPWLSFRFVIPAKLLRERGNRIAAEINDINETFGPTPGRHFEPGIFRPIRIERRPRTRITEVHPLMVLSDDLTRVDVTVSIALEGPDQPQLSCALIDAATGKVVAERSAAAGRLVFSLDHPRLWSPDLPNIYRLDVRAGDDHWSDIVGFRRLETRGPDILLNGKRIVLAGVCRHEFVAELGYAASEAHARREMARIRHAGFNHVRLVHSPQAAWVPRIAAEVGLLVSEEPGACFHDLSDPRIADGAVAALSDLVKRDRHLPSIYAWYIYNECLPCTPYAVRAVAACRALDPGCLTSMADCSGRKDDILAMVAASGLSIYGINIYTMWGNDYAKILDWYTDRPVVMTEWGGMMTLGNKRVLGDHCKHWSATLRAEAPKRFAGCSFWAWADYEERRRMAPAAVEGWTIEGLVDRHGHAREALADMSQWAFDLRHPPIPKRAPVEILRQSPLRSGAWRTLDLAAVAGDQTDAETRLRAVSANAPAAGTMPVAERIIVDGVPFRPRCGQDGWMPLLLAGMRKEVTIPVSGKVTSIAVLGHSAFAAAWPGNAVHSVHHRDQEPARRPGDAAASFIFDYADGSVTVPQRHGIEVLRGNDICRWWTTGARSPAVVPAVRLVVDEDCFILRLDLAELALDPKRDLKQIRWQLEDQEAIISLFALSVQGA